MTLNALTNEKHQDFLFFKGFDCAGTVTSLSCDVIRMIVILCELVLSNLPGTASLLDSVASRCGTTSRRRREIESASTNKSLSVLTTPDRNC